MLQLLNYVFSETDWYNTLVTHGELTTCHRQLSQDLIKTLLLKAKRGGNLFEVVRTTWVHFKCSYSKFCVKMALFSLSDGNVIPRMFIAWHAVKNRTVPPPCHVCTCEFQISNIVASFTLRCCSLMEARLTLHANVKWSAFILVACGCIVQCECQKSPFAPVFSSTLNRRAATLVSQKKMSCWCDNQLMDWDFF